MNDLRLIEIATLAIVMLCWFGFAASFVFRKRPPKATERKRDISSIKGIAFQGLGFALVWSFRRPLFSPIVTDSLIVEILFSIIAVVCAVTSVLLVISAVKLLGKEWSLTARVVLNHKLATTGPYSITRNPIYTGMLGMLLSTGLVVSNWKILLPAMVIFLLGTLIRVRSEERLLSEAFGNEFRIYKENVPAIIPGLF